MQLKKKQDISLEMLFAVISSIALLFMATALIMPRDEPQKLSAFLADVVNDGSLSSQEYRLLKDLSCDDIKMMLGTSKDVCIYFKDKDGNIVDLTGEGKFGIGCSGLHVNGTMICTG